LIHYLDSSALVKRYVQESGSSSLRQLFRGRNLATARIAYAEIAAAISRLCREDVIEQPDRERILGQLDLDFSALTVVEIRVPVVRRVPELVRRRPLRGYDAVHVAAALTLRDRGIAVTFWAADRGLTDAARAEGLRTTLLT